MTEKKVTLKKERAEKIAINEHPWIFSGAVYDVSKDVRNGDIVEVKTPTEKTVAFGAYNSNSDIRIRVISWSESVNDEWFKTKIRQLASVKEQMLGISDFPEDNKNYRVVFSDADSVPGLIMDRYGLVFVIQLQTLFADIKKDLWISIIKELWNPTAIYERSDVEVRKKEGLTSMPSVLLFGKLPDPLVIEEDGFKILVDIPGGQKTGYFFDLRQAKRQVEQWCSVFGVKYLQNYFGYTGSFNLYATRAGVTRIEHIDISDAANNIAQKMSDMNGTQDIVSITTSDCFEFLKGTQEESVDAIILDPPSFVKDRNKIVNAFEGYSRLNRLALKNLKKGGLLFTVCCSSYISEEMFQKILFKSSSEAHCELKLIEKLGHDVDHSWPLNFPESRYLQCWVLSKN